MATSYLSASDPYWSFSAGLDSFGDNSLAITPSDTVDLAAYPKGVVVTAAGNLVVLPLKAADDGAHLITFTGAAVGFILPFRVRRVMATGTTALVASIFD
jgi:hypothetical protein